MKFGASPLRKARRQTVLLTQCLQLCQTTCFESTDGPQGLLDADLGTCHLGSCHLVMVDSRLHHPLVVVSKVSTSTTSIIVGCSSHFVFFTQQLVIVVVSISEL